jgi:putative FmdB family regulatory protein
MPIFEYSCGRCGERFEALLPRAEADRTVCPKCGATKVRRELSTFAPAVGGSRPSPVCAESGCPFPGGAAGAGGCAGGSCPFGPR